MPELNAIVTHRTDIAPGLMIMRVAPVGWELPPFKAGQFAVLGLPVESPRSPESLPEEAEPKDAFLRRAYSIASSSLNREYLEFYILEVKTGGLTPRLFSLQEGDRLWVGPKLTGMFTLDQVAPERNLVFIATGTGLAPYMSMLRTHLGADGTRRFAVIHGARYSQDLGYRSELFHLQRDHGNFLYLPVLTRPDTDPEPWRGATGHLQEFWRTGPLTGPWGAAPTPADTDFFLCGNPGMVEAMVKILGEDGFIEHTRKQPGQIHFEKYW
ncbi:MAG: ferredoxin--NADP reductase [Holophaga sp.]|nr:ferredoxin--NADP reductase [Holophaga sp.]